MKLLLSFLNSQKYVNTQNILDMVGYLNAMKSEGILWENGTKTISLVKNK